MNLACVVVFYNPTDDNINNLKKYIDSIDRLYVVDNSEDDVIRVEDTDKIKYIKLGENKGIAAALNIGAQEAIKENFKFLLTLDQDSLITSDIVNAMKDYLINNDFKKIGLISPYHDINTPDEKNGDVEEKIEVMTSGNIINLDAYKAIGGYKDWLFIDCVDYDYCMNLNKHGYKVLRLNNVIMKHELGNLVVHKLFGKEYPCYNYNSLRRYYMVRNNHYINQLYCDLYPDYCKRLLRIQRGQVKRVLLFEKNKIKKLRYMYKGYKDFKKGIKGKLNS